MKKTEDYYLGLDIGTGSVANAVTNKHYQLLKFNGKSMWGVRLFDSAQTAEKRRISRTVRRRQERRKQRVRLLEEIFASAISDIDMGFFQRLKESALYSDDKSVNQTNTLFNDTNYKDKDYHKEFPTIYHLRKELLLSGNRDIRLIYLAIHHIVKNRGHFLFEGQDMQVANDIENLFQGLRATAQNLYDLDIKYNNLDKLEQEFATKFFNITQKKQLFSSCFSLIDNNESYSPKETADMYKAWVALISGGQVKTQNIFNTDQYNDIVDAVCFNSSYDEIEESLIQAFGDDYDLIARLKAIHDWSKLRGVLGTHNYISYAMVEKYDKHKQDLIKLKRLVKTHFANDYDTIFKSASKENKHNYSHYVGLAIIGGKKQSLGSKCSQEDFYKFIKKILSRKGEELSENNDYKEIIMDIENSNFLTKQISKDNSIIPHQVNKHELEIILENAATHHPFLTENRDGYIVRDMIMSIFLYRIPYYVGPINTFHASDDKIKGIWAVKKSNTPVRPWNLDKVIDVEASAEKFITKMTNKCTYLVGADVLPKHSLLYSKYVVLNELNNLRIDSKPISVEQKQQIYTQLFMVQKRVTARQVFDWLVRNGDIEKKGLPKDRLSGFDIEFKGSLSSYIAFKNILGERADSEQQMVEDIIKWITLFEDKRILMSKLKVYDNKLSAQEKESIKKLSFKGWGRLSRELLEEVEAPDNQGELQSIINYMFNTNQNFMQIYYDYGFEKKVDEINNKNQTSINNIHYGLVENLVCSPAVKRQIYQSLLIIKEIRKIIKKDPCKLFVEMAREEVPEQKKKRTVTRKERLKELYKNCQKEYPQLLAELDSKSDDELRNNRLYLYFTQLGRCMYSGEQIDISAISRENNIYDRDHIYPQSKVKDDSLDNLVLVRKDLNAKKSNELVSDNVQAKNIEHWRVLEKKGLISKEKFYRLTRKDLFTEAEFQDFINRQLVETRQSTKIITKLLEQLLPNTEIVYSKAGNISAFRQKFDLIKVREINDLHHAHDAYLNIVVGNVYNTKFNHNAQLFFRKNYDNHYNLVNLFERNLIKDGIYAWNVEPGQRTIALVKKTLLQRDILISRHAFTQKGEFFNQNISKASDKDLVPIKNNGPLSNVARYGGYSGVNTAYFMLIEHKEKKKTVRSLETIPIYIVEQEKNKKGMIMEYLLQTLQLKDPKILINKIKKNTLFRIGNSYVYIVGGSKADPRILWHNANQLFLSRSMEKYLKKLVNFKNKSKKFYIELNKLVADDYDKLCTYKNLELYDLFTDKLQSKYYKDLNISKISEKLTDVREAFINLTVEKQALELLEILNLFTCNASKANLRWISKKSWGIVRTNKKISDIDITMINMSVTGLFTKEINLNEL